MKLLDELQEMYLRCNCWEKPYADFPNKWTRQDSRTTCLVLAKIIRMMKEKK